MDAFSSNRDYFNNKKVVVTGGAGFIGSHLVDVLVAKNALVTVLDILEPELLHNLCKSLEGITYHKTDLLNKEKTLELLDGAEIIFHLAGNASVPLSVQDPSMDFEENVLSTFNVLQALINRRVQKIVYISSAAVYGLPKYVPTNEEHPLNPISPYGATKAAAEIIGLTYAKVFNVDFIVGRLYSPFGPRQRRYAMYDLLNKLHNDSTQLTVLGDGSQVRDYIYISDAIDAILTIAQYGHRGDAYNISGNNRTSIRDLIYLLAKVSGCDSYTHISYTGQSWAGDPPEMDADTTKLRALGFNPGVTLYDGIKKLFDWMSEEVWVRQNEN